MKRIGGAAYKPSPKMNVTPLVDVVLVLLIIFMIAIPSMENNAQVELPQIFNVDEHREGQMDPVTVSIDTEGALFFEQDQVPDDELVRRLERVHELTPTRRIILRADAQHPYARVREVFGLVQQIGFSGLSLKVGEAHSDSGRDAEEE